MTRPAQLPKSPAARRGSRRARPRLRGARAATAALLAALSGSATAQQALAERFETCLACHGPGGVSQLALTPSLAGQHSFYAITQLFLFREGRRNSETMTAMAKGMTDADLRDFSDLIAKLPASSAAADTPADATRVSAGRALAQLFRCASCHGADFAGGQQVRRIGGQREDYLQKALSEFNVGQRIGYTPAMNEVMVGIQPTELADLAHYVSHLPKTGR